MIAHNLGIPKIMKLIHQAVVKGFMFCVPDHLHPDSAQLFKGAVDGSLVHMILAVVLPTFLGVYCGGG
jgi:hypothetical protein